MAIAPTVSVVMAVYNGGRFLEESVASILAQRFGDVEFVVVDDGSTDGTPEILARASRQDGRIRVIRQERRGQTAALICGVREARGRYVARQDADDVSLPERFERQVRYLDTHPAVAVLGCRAEVIDEAGEVTGIVPSRHGVEQVRAGLLTFRATMVHSSIMMRRDAYEAVGGYREAFRVAQDIDLWLRMVQRFDVDNLPEPFLRWRINREGVYVRQRTLQLQYGGIALAFAHERRRYGEDSYEPFRLFNGDLEAFAATYRLGGYLHALWGELLFRGLRDPAAARVHFQRALARGFIRPRTLGLFGLSLTGRGWPGGAPMPAVSR